MAKEVADAEKGIVTKRLRKTMEQRGNEEKGRDRGRKYGDRAVITAVATKAEPQMSLQRNRCYFKNMYIYR